MNRSIIFVLLLLLGPFSAWGQYPEPDTSFALPHITVTAARGDSLSQMEAPLRVTRLTRRTIERSGADNLGSLLASHGTTFIKRYGTTGLSSLSLRGTGPSQTTYLLNGHRIANPQLGQLDLTLLPTAFLESVEIMHGAASPLYGSAGLGGAVNVQTPSPWTNQPSYLRGGIGPFGERKTSALTSVNSESLGLVAGGSYLGTDGDFPYLNRATFPPKKMRREGADRQQFSIFSSGGYDFDTAQLNVGGWYTNAERGLPGLSTTPPSGERQWDEKTRIWTNASTSTRWGRIEGGAFAQFARLRYRNPDLDLDQTGHTRRISLRGRTAITTLPDWSVSTAINVLNTRAQHPRLAGSASRHNTSLSVSGIGSYSVIRLYPALRIDGYAERGSGRSTRVAASPRLGLNARLPFDPVVHAKASIGRSFRMPTLNDRYWQPGGNPTLQPEKGWTVDAGLIRSTGTLSAELSLFRTWIRNRITWIPTDDGHWSPRNVGQTRSQGVELSADKRWKLSPDLQLMTGGLYLFTDARNQTNPSDPSYNKPLRYRPRHQTKIHAGVEWTGLGLGLMGRYIGRRFVTTDGSQSLDPYVVIDARISARHQLGPTSAELSILGENLLDRQYSVIQYYPMPPRHLRATLTLTLP